MWSVIVLRFFNVGFGGLLQEETTPDFAVLLDESQLVIVGYS